MSTNGKILGVFNTCGIGGKDDADIYIRHFGSLLESTDTARHHFVISDCLCSEQTRKALREFVLDMGFNTVEINDKVPVNVSFNHTVNAMVELDGEYDGYLYVDSGISFPDPDCFTKLVERFQTGKYGMVSATPNTDTGFQNWLGTEDLPEDFIVPIGRACNLHCQIFHNDIRRAYGNVLPDIFASFCTESTFSFLNAAINKKWVICKDAKCDHKVSMDGPSSGFYPNNVIPWFHMFKSRRPMQEVIADPLAYEVGFGYEEVRSVLNHDRAKFDENGFALDSRLKDFLRDNLYLSKDVFDYDSIQTQVY